MNSKYIPLVHSDSRGKIEMILEKCKVQSISRITSKPGSTRAKHWHKNDGHWIECLAGEVWLYERSLDSKEKPTLTIVNPGETAFTGPLVEHEMFFPSFNIFNCYSLLPRTSENYENETVRFEYSLQEIYDSWPES